MDTDIVYITSPAKKAKSRQDVVGEIRGVATFCFWRGQTMTWGAGDSKQGRRTMLKFKVGPIIHCEWNAADWADSDKMGSHRQTSTKLITGDMVGCTGDASPYLPWWLCLWIKYMLRL